jgi:hypothetical protein
VGVKQASRFRVILPWLVALALLLYLFEMVPAARLREAVERADPAVFLGLCAFFVVLLLVADGFATWVTFRRTLPDVPLGYREVVSLRAATYLLSILHYGVGQGGLAWFLATRHKVPVARAAGAVMVTVGVNFLLVTATAAAGIALGGAPADPRLRLLVYGLAAGVPIYLAVVAWRPAFLARTRVLEPIFAAGLGGNLAIAAARVPHLATLIVGNYVMMRLFGVEPPFTDALALLPVVFAVATIPLAPSGLGTAQATAVAVFAPFAAGVTHEERAAAVLAYSLGFQFAALLMQAALGLVFLRLVTRRGTLPSAPDSTG